MVQGQRKRRSNHDSTKASQRLGEVLVEMEASDQGVGSAAVGEERRFGCVRMLMQGFQDYSGISEIPTPCWSWRRGIGIISQFGLLDFHLSFVLGSPK